MQYNPASCRTDGSCCAMAKAEAGMAVNKGAIHALCVLDPGVAAVTLRLMCHAASARKTTLWRVVVDVSLSARA